MNVSKPFSQRASTCWCCHLHRHPISIVTVKQYNARPCSFISCYSHMLRINITVCNVNETTILPSHPLLHHPQAPGQIEDRDRPAFYLPSQEPWAQAPRRPNRHPRRMHQKQPSQSRPPQNSVLWGRQTLRCQLLEKELPAISLLAPLEQEEVSKTRLLVEE